MKRRLIIALGLLISLPAVYANQDKDLSALFGLLQSTSDPREGAAVTRQIWSHWHTTDNVAAAELFDAGVQHMANDELQQAREFFTRSIEQDPTFAEAWNKRAMVHFWLGDVTQSAEDVKQTLRLEPRHFGALAGMGWIYLRQGDAIAARTAFQRALHLNPFLHDIADNLQQLERDIRRNAI
ncbi:MAG TPA: hypothetical protein DD979_06890 [Gammaproteobacteria bacterium]|nr:hypothetical protein [Gammaproteobacteria bacterium]